MQQARCIVLLQVVLQHQLGPIMITETKVSVLVIMFIIVNVIIHIIVVFLLLYATIDVSS